jgi:hypothetical protein
VDAVGRLVVLGLVADERSLPVDDHRVVARGIRPDVVVEGGRRLRVVRRSGGLGTVSTIVTTTRQLVGNWSTMWS